MVEVEDEGEEVGTGGGLDGVEEIRVDGGAVGEEEAAERERAKEDREVKRGLGVFIEGVGVGSKFDEEHSTLKVLSTDGPVQGTISTGVRKIEGRAVHLQQSDDRLVAVLNGDVERGKTISKSPAVGIKVALEEDEGDPGVSFAGCDVEGCFSEGVLVEG